MPSNRERALELMRGHLRDGRTLVDAIAATLSEAEARGLERAAAMAVGCLGMKSIEAISHALEIVIREIRAEAERVRKGEA